MRFEVTIEKKHVVSIALVLSVFLGLFFVTAYNTSPPNPAVMGHTANEMGILRHANFTSGPLGTGNAGPNTFGGRDASYNSTYFYFPGKLAIGYDPFVPPKYSGAPDRNLVISSSTPYAGFALESRSDGPDPALGDIYFDFIHNGDIKSNINFHHFDQTLYINGMDNYANLALNFQRKGIVDIGGSALNITTPNQIRIAKFAGLGGGYVCVDNAGVIFVSDTATC